MKIYYYSLVLIFSVTLWGCSNGNSSSPAVSAALDPATGKHAAGWALNGNGGAHPQGYFDNPAGCQECHGTDLKGGISGVSCSNPGRSGVACHAQFPHPEGFAAFNIHGNSAKAAPGTFTGLAHCQKCHGLLYTGKTPAPSCIACHKLSNSTNDAPHAANWVSGNVNGLKHSTTDSGNAPACFQCHAGGKFSHPAPVPAAAGTAPGCFNGTMCHNAAGHTFTVVGHYQPARENLASCQTCHATPATGSNPRFTIPKNATLSPNGCENCHNRPGLAHPYIWLPGRGGSPTASHSNAQNIVASCGMCHGGAALTGGGTAYPGGISPPACFSTPVQGIGGTACHFTMPINAGGTTVGCSSCHGAPPNGINSPTTGPNRAFRHTNHFAIIGADGASLGCAACHYGLGSGTTSHSTKLVFGAVTAAVAVQQTLGSPVFNNRSTNAVYASTTGKCTNVSCHGGKTLPFPAWKNTTLTFNMNTCTNCHQTSAVAQEVYSGIYIGPFSGNNDSPALSPPGTPGGIATATPFAPPPGPGMNLHQVHAVYGQCTDCHNTSGLHFSSIMQGRRSLRPGFAAPTVKGSSIISYSYNSSTGTSSCVATCHFALPQSWYK